MDVITLVDAKACLSEHVDRFEAGDSIDVTRHGKPVARLIAEARPRKRIDTTLLQSLAATMSSRIWPKPKVAIAPRAHLVTLPIFYRKQPSAEACARLTPTVLYPVVSFAATDLIPIFR